MVAVRKIIETAMRMSLADLSVLISALQQEQRDDARLMTIEGSENHILWSAMAEKGWLIERGNPRPNMPLTMASFSISPAFRNHVGAIAVVCYEGLRQGMSFEEIIAFGEGGPDPRLNHLL